MSDREREAIERVRQAWRSLDYERSKKPRDDMVFVAGAWRTLTKCSDCVRRQALNDALIKQHEQDIQRVTDSLLKIIRRQEIQIEKMQKDGRHFALVRRTP